MSTGSRRFVSLSVHDFGGIRLVETELNAGGNVINGRNGSGKSSLLAAIATLLHGKKGAPEVPVREGAERAEVVGVLDDGSRISVSQTAGGTFQLHLHDSVGHIVPSPLTVLERIRGAAGVDPVRLAWEDNPSDLILRALGIDVSGIDGEIKELAQQRLDAGREVRKLEPVVEQAEKALRDAGGRAVERVDVRELMDEYQKAVAAERAISAHTSKLEARRDAEIAFEEIVKKQPARSRHKLEQSIRELDTEEDILRQRLATIAKMREACRQEVSEVARWEMQRDHAEASVRRIASDIEQSQIVAPPKRPAEVVKQSIDNVGVHNERWAAGQALDAHRAALGKARQAQANAEQALEAKRAKRRKLLVDSGLAIDGLEITAEGTVTYQGRPWMAASAGERLRVAIEVLFASKSQLRVAWTRDGDRLDDENLAAIIEACDARGLQLFIERTGIRDAGALVLENGIAKGVVG